LVPCAIILNGWALSVMWGWFFVPLGLPAIGVVWAIGIAGTVAMLTRKDSNTKSEDNAQEQLAYNVLKAFITPLVCVGIGWLVHLFM